MTTRHSSRPAMRTTWLTLAAGASLLFLACESACAGTGIELWPLLDTSQQYTDNLLLAANAESDEVTTVVGGASFALDNPRQRFQLDYLTDGQLYAEHSEFDRLAKDQYAGLHYQQSIDETTNLWAGDTFIDGQSMFGMALVGAQGLNPQLGQALLQRDAMTNQFDSSLHHDFLPRLTADFGIHQSLYTASNASPGVSLDQGAESTAYYALSERLRAGIGCDVEDFRFSSAPRSDAYIPYFALAMDVSRRLRLSGQAGPLVTQSSSGIGTDVGYLAAAQYVAKRWSVNFTSGRAASMTAGYAGAGISQFAYSSSAYALSRRTTLYTSAGYNELSGGGVSAELISFAAGANYRLDRHFTLYAQYLWFRTTRPDSPAALSNAVAVGLKLDARPWHWMWQ